MKANLYFDENNEIVGYRTYPLNLEELTIELDEAPKDLVIGHYRYENNTYVKTTSNSNIEITISTYSKELLIKAFNEYRNNVNYGVIQEDEATHQLVLDWYNGLINNNLNCINNPPAVIIKYMEDNSWI